MLTYRALLSPQSAALSPWQADTLFGHLCWLLLYEYGEAYLLDFLAAYRSPDPRPPLLFSDGFPAGWLPRPLLPLCPTAARPRLKREQAQALQDSKEDKRRRWLSLEDFNALRRGETPPLSGPGLQLKASRPVLKNQINRLTGGTTALDDAPGSGNLYSLQEIRLVESQSAAPQELAVYLRAADEAAAARAGEWLKQLSCSGYGAKKSSGYGQFSLMEFAPFPAFDPPLASANGFVSLSNWTPAATDPTQGYYATLVKYGKLGEELVCTGNPFKFPLTMLKAGSAFYAPDPLRPWYGRLLEGVAPGAPQVVHYAFAFALPARLDPQGEVF